MNNYAPTQFGGIHCYEVSIGACAFFRDSQQSKARQAVRRQQNHSGAFAARLLSFIAKLPTLVAPDWQKHEQLQASILTSQFTAV
jgi:hypothetical protein